MTEKMLSGKVAVVTGAGSGIGGAICLTFAQAGAKLACLDTNDSAAAETAAAWGRDALALRCDVSSEAETKAAAL